MDIFSKLASRYKTPFQVQRYIQTFPYNASETMRSARNVLLAKRAHCLEAAFLAAAILEKVGFPPMVLSLESQDRIDHVVYVFKENGKWGSIGRSKELGLQGRRPIFSSLRKLAYSYYEPFVDDTGRLQAYVLANLDDSNSDWRYSKRNVWKTEDYLLSLKHEPIFVAERRFRRLRDRFVSGKTPIIKSYWR